jgi:hypothetical protein
MNIPANVKSMLDGTNRLTDFYVPETPIEFFLYVLESAQSVSRLRNTSDADSSAAAVTPLRLNKAMRLRFFGCGNPSHAVRLPPTN